MILLLALGCAAPDDGPLETGWTLVWSDSFDGAAGTAPDPDVWVPDVGGDGWGNAQLEYNTDRTDNAQLDGEGRLAIIAKREDYMGNAYTSARLTTNGTKAFGAGRIEADLQMPAGTGLWPAFWALGDDFGDVGCVDFPEGNAPQLPTGRNWLYVGLVWEQRGLTYSVKKEWRASGRRGWNNDIYSRG